MGLLFSEVGFPSLTIIIARYSWQCQLKYEINTPFIQGERATHTCCLNREGKREQEKERDRESERQREKQARYVYLK